MASRKSVINLILEDHEEFRSQFPQVLDATGDERQKRFDELMGHLIRHEVAEEEVVWPAVRDSVPNGNALADARTHEEEEGEKLLRELEKMGTASPRFEKEFKRLKDDVLDHASKEETLVLPSLVENNSDEQLKNLGEWWERMKKIAPTHPHPKAPNSAAGTLIGGPVLSMIDRIRDAVRDMKARSS